MNLNVPRVRMFAGPNGSGKSTIKSVIKKELLGVYVNPDDIEKEIKKNDFLDFDCYEIKTNETEVLDFIQNHKLLEISDLTLEAEDLTFNDNKLDFFNVSVNSYFASACADFIRHKLLETRKSFTFETVMSSNDKVEFLKLAKKLGYRTYLYFVATTDPIININRVKNRVKQGGHDVPEEKIISRYYRSLDNLLGAIKETSRAYIFDNSSHTYRWLCEITDTKTLELKQDEIPNWLVKYLIDKI